MRKDVPKEKSRKAAERGSAMVEFTLAAGLFLVPLLLGTIIIGQNLIREIETTQVCRDASHMYAYGVDFSVPSNQQILVNIGQGLNLQVSGGNAVVILSTVTYIDGTACQAGGYQPNSSSCANYDQTVFTRRIVIGNSSIRQSAFGTPNPSLIDSSGNISPAGYLNDTSTRAVGFSTLIPLSAGQFAYMGEMFLSSPDLDWWGFLGNTGTSARSIF